MGVCQVSKIAKYPIFRRRTPSKPLTPALLTNRADSANINGQSCGTAFAEVDMAQAATRTYAVIVGIALTAALCRPPGVSAGEAEIRLDGSRSATVVLGKTSVRLDLESGGSIVSIKHGDREFVKVDGRNTPLLYLVECFDGSNKIAFTNRDAKHTRASTVGGALKIKNSGHGEWPVDVEATIRPDEPTGLIHWNIAVENKSDLGIISVEYPYILTPNSLGDISDDRILAKGMLTNFPDPVKGFWHWSDKYWNLKHPQTGMQFVAFYDGASGLYLSSQDTEGYTKRNNILRIVDQMKFSHTFYAEYSRGNSYRSPYPIVLTTFDGGPSARTSWRHAADIYRRWAEKQWWCRTKWFDRPDVPDWLKEGAGVIVPRKYMTYAKDGESYYKYLWVEGKRYSEAVGGRNIIVLFHGWSEGMNKATQLGHPKPVPHEPFKGSELFRQACAKMRENGCFPFVFIAAPHLYVHTFGGGDYDNKRLYLKEAKNYEIYPLKYFLKEAQPPSDVPTLVHMCPGTEYWRECVRKQCLQLVELGVDVIQLDGFPQTALCYNPDHGHPLGGGKWYYQSWKRLCREIQAECRRRNPRFVLTTEWPCELYIPLVQLTMKRWGLAKKWMVGEGMVPVYEYVYGDYDKSYGGEGDSTHIGPRTDTPPGKENEGNYTSFGMARNLCYGLFPTIAFGLDRKSLDPATRNQYHMRFYREHIAALGGYARKYLLRGRMVRSPRFDNPPASVRFWGWWLKPPRTSLYPYRAVIHSAWQAPDNDVACFFVNITGTPCEIDVEIPNYPGLAEAEIVLRVSGEKRTLARGVRLPHRVKLRLEPAALVMLEARALPEE